MSDAPDLDIALVGPAHPYRGGIAHFNDWMREGLEGRDQSVDIYTFTRQYPGLLFPGKTQEAPSTATTKPPIRSIDSINPVSWVRTASAIRSP